MNKEITPYIYILFFTLYFNPTYGQKIELNISSIDSTSTTFLQNINFQKEHFTKKSLYKSLDSIKHKLELLGFININVDSIVKNDHIYTVHLNLRNQIQKIRVYFDNKEVTLNQLSNLTGLVTPNYFEVSPITLTNNLQRITGKLEKEGKSFSEVTLTNISIKNDSLIESHLLLKKSTSRKIDKVIINGYAEFPKTFLVHKLRLKRNAIFRKEKLDLASDAINTIPFVSETKPPEILFTKDSTIIYLNLKKENANKFDGLIGFSSNESGKGLTLNGHLDFSLNNLFNSGENINLIWKNNGSNRQVFNFDICLPYVFNSRTSPSLALNIYKQDSTFVNTQFRFSLPYQINPRNSMGIIFHSETSVNLLSNFNNSIEDFKTLFYGMNYNYTIPNQHSLFKTKFNFQLEALTGKRNSTYNNSQNKLNLKTNYLLSLNLKNHIFLQNQSSILQSDEYLTNELLRVGGMNTIRGFDEESIFANTYSIFTLEYRYNPNISSYLYSITDFGFIGNKNLTTQSYAFGLGYAFSSKLGFINLGYAIGADSNQTVNVNNSRFHLKILNFF